MVDHFADDSAFNDNVAIEIAAQWRRRYEFLRSGPEGLS